MIEQTADTLDLNSEAVIAKALLVRAEISALIEPFDYYYGHFFASTEVLEPNLIKEVEQLKQTLSTIDRLCHLLEARRLIANSNETQSKLTTES